MGHSLGLDHSNGPDDVMFAGARNKAFTSVTLSATDQQRIKAKIGLHSSEIEKRRRRRKGEEDKEKRRRMEIQK